MVQKTYVDFVKKMKRHLIISSSNECPYFYLDRVGLLQNQSILNSLKWDPKTLLKFENIGTIKDALSFSDK